MLDSTRDEPIPSALQTSGIKFWHSNMQVVLCSADGLSKINQFQNLLTQKNKADNQLWIF